MHSSSDFEKLWFLHKTEGEPKGISINSFCVEAFVKQATPRMLPGNILVTTSGGGALIVPDEAAKKS